MKSNSWGNYSIFHHPSLYLRKFKLIQISPDPSFSFWLYKYLSLLFSYWSIPLIPCNPFGSYSLLFNLLINFTYGLNSTFPVALSILSATKTTVCNFFQFLSVLSTLFTRLKYLLQVLPQVFAYIVIKIPMTLLKNLLYSNYR